MHFVNSLTPSVKYKDYVLTNDMVNLELCLSFKKDKTAYYPDNVGIPNIEFLMIGGDSIKWNFNNEKDRDASYHSIMETFE